MKSKIDYHVLTMDEIVFDNRNKAYGAFIVRQHYERNLLKAIFISIGVFGLAMSSPAILRNLGLMAGTQTESFVEEIFKLEDFQGIRGVTTVTKTEQTSASSDTREKEVTPEKANKLPPEKPETTAASTAAAGTGTTAGSDGGTSSGTGQVIKIDEVIKEKAPEFYDSKSVDKMPEFIGGQPAFEEFVQDNIIYPADEKTDGVEGTVRIQFIVKEDGALERITISQSSGNRNLDKEALRLVRSLPKYKPGRQNGVAVKVLCVLPIHFIVE